MPSDAQRTPIIEVKDAILRYPLSGYSRGSIKSSLLTGRSGSNKRERTYVEALSGVSFTVYQGDRVGIIGRNGAGKSTILRAIAGIYPLEQGSIAVNGRVRGLYDLAVGFEAEETGRRNIYYRGYLLGYKHAQISQLEQQIIDFAEIGDFIDLPIRTYSAGMTIRLAFSISTMLGGDALLIDEILAAGDAEFAVKAASRMMALIDEASCIVLVSHDMTSIAKICNRVIWLEHGRIHEDGAPEVVIPAYTGIPLPVPAAAATAPDDQNDEVPDAERASSNVTQLKAS